MEVFGFLGVLLRSGNCLERLNNLDINEEKKLQLQLFADSSTAYTLKTITIYLL